MRSAARSQTPADFAKELAGPLAAKYPRHNAAWQFGYGAYDDAAKRVALVHGAPALYRIGLAGRGGAARPGNRLGDSARRGGTCRQRSAARRDSPLGRPAAVECWRSPASSSIRRKTATACGAGLFPAGRACLANGRSRPAKSTTNVPRLEVEAGETIDFVTDCVGRSDERFVRVGRAIETGGQPRVRRCDAWDSAADFHGPLGVSDLPQQIAYAWQIAYQRPITADEWEAGLPVCREANRPSAGRSATNPTTSWRP